MGVSGKRLTKKIYMHICITHRQTIMWWRSEEGLEGVNGGAKRDICKTFNNKDNYFLKIPVEIATLPLSLLSNGWCVTLGQV